MTCQKKDRRKKLGMAEGRMNCILLQAKRRHIWASILVAPATGWPREHSPSPGGWKAARLPARPLGNINGSQSQAVAEPSVQASNPAICDTICYLLACASVGMWSREQRDRMVSPTSDLIMRLNTWPIDVQEYLIHCRIFFINFSA